MWFCLFLELSDPSNFWVEAISTAVHLINCLPSPKLQYQPPYFRLYEKYPKYDHIHTFICVSFVHSPPLIAPSSQLNLQNVHSWINQHQQGFLWYDPSIQRTRISCNVNFTKTQYFSQHQEICLPPFQVSFLHKFYDILSADQFKPTVVYTRQRHQEDNTIEQAH